MLVAELALADRFNGAEGARIRLKRELSDVKAQLGLR